LTDIVLNSQESFDNTQQFVNEQGMAIPNWRHRV